MTYEGEFMLGDIVTIDGDAELHGVIDAYLFALDGAVKVVRYHAGVRYDEWLAEERLTKRG